MSNVLEGFTRIDPVEDGMKELEGFTPLEPQTRPTESENQENLKRVIKEANAKDYSQGRKTLAGLKKHREMGGGPLPWRNDLLAGADSQTRAEIIDFFKSQEGFKEGSPFWLGTVGTTATGESIPWTPPGDNPVSEFFTNTQLGRGLWNLDKSFESGWKQGVETIASGVDVTAKTMGKDWDASGFVKKYLTSVNGKNAPGDNFIEDTVDEFGRVLPAVLATPQALYTTIATTKTGLALQSAVLAAIEASVSKEGSGLTPLEGYLRSFSTDEDKQEVLGRLGLAADIMTIGQLGKGALEGLGFIGTAIKERIKNPIKKGINPAFRDTKTAEQFLIDVLSPLEVADKETRLAVTKMLRKSINDASDNVSGDAFTRFFNDLGDQISTLDPESDKSLIQNVELVRDHLMSMKAAVDTKKGVLPETAAADLRFRGEPEAVRERSMSQYPEGSMEVSRNTLVQARENLAGTRDDLVGREQNLPRVVSDKVIAAEEAGYRQAHQAYEDAKELASELDVTDEIKQMAVGLTTSSNPAVKKVADQLVSEEASMKTGIDSIKTLRDAYGKTSNQEEREAIKSLIAGIYNFGDEDTILPDALQAARNKWRTYIQTASDPLGGPGVGQINQMGRSAKTIPAQATQVQRGTDTMRQALDPNMEPEVQESIRNILRQYGQEGDELLVSEAISAKPLREAADKKLSLTDKYLEDVTDVHDPSRVSDAPAVRSFGKLFDNAGSDKVRFIMEEAEKYPSAQKEVIVNGLRRAWFENLATKIFKDESGRQVLDTGKSMDIRSKEFWDVTRRLFKDEEAAEGFAKLVDSIKKVENVSSRVGGSANRSIPQAVKLAFAGSGDMHMAKNVLVTTFLGVLNPVATKARNVGGIAIDTLTANIDRSKFLDSLLSDPSALKEISKVFESNLEKEIGWKGLRQVFDTVLKRAMVRGAGGRTEAEDQYNKYMELLQMEYEQEKLESESQ